MKDQSLNDTQPVNNDTNKEVSFNSTLNNLKPMSDEQLKLYNETIDNPNIGLSEKVLLLNSKYGK